MRIEIVTDSWYEEKIKELNIGKFFYLRIIESLRDGFGNVENSSAIAAHYKDKALRGLK